MHKKSADEFQMGNGNILSHVGTIIFCRKSHMVICDRFYSGVANRNTMCIPAKIIDGITKAVKGLFNKGNPLSAVKGIPEFSPCVRVFQLFTGRRKVQPTGKIQILQHCQELAAKLCRKNLNWNKKVFAAAFELLGFGKPGTSHNAVYVGMEI